jgi:rod shape-determining protein MreD
LSRNRVVQATPFVGPLWWHAAVWLAIALLFQITFARFFALHNAFPSAVLVVVVWYAIRVDTRRAATYGLVAGLCQDILATGSGAAWTISTMSVAVLAGTLSSNFFADSLPLAAAMAAFATLVGQAIFWIVMALEGYPPGLGVVHFHQALWEALLNAILIVIAVLLVRWRENYRTR